MERDDSNNPTAVRKTMRRATTLLRRPNHWTATIVHICLKAIFLPGAAECDFDRFANVDRHHTLLHA
jgi:hypothetical protein